VVISAGHGHSINEVRPFDACRLRRRQSHLRRTFCHAHCCSVLNSCHDVFAPATARLTRWHMQVLPRLKKAGLDSSSPANHRLISSLSTACKVLDSLVLTRLQLHLLGPPTSSSSSLPTGRVILDEIFTAVEDKWVTILILLAAFDMVNHSILLQRL